MATVTIRFTSGRSKKYYNARYFTTKTEVIVYGTGRDKSKELGRHKLKTVKTWTSK